MKRKLVLLGAVVCFLLSGCKFDTKKIARTATLYTTMGPGSEAVEIEEHDWVYSGELTAEELARGLSETTGLDYFISAKEAEDGLSIDWKNDSTLIANLDGREQKEEFFFFEADSMRWFMMESLWLTLTNNLEVEHIYYTMNDGEELSFEELYPVKTFFAGIPYLGYAFYEAHSDVIGNMGDEFSEMTMDEAVAQMNREELQEYIENRLENQRLQREELGPYTLEDAMALIINVMESRNEKAQKLVASGDETIDGEHVFVIMAGEDSADGEKFTAMYHYAVSDSGRVYVMDPLVGPDWNLLEANDSGAKG